MASSLQRAERDDYHIVDGLRGTPSLPACNKDKIKIRHRGEQKCSYMCDCGTGWPVKNC
jgi:hypothetical protein